MTPNNSTIILGAKGTLGQELVRVFRIRGDTVIEWDREECDITDEQEARDKITQRAPTLIINAAAYNDVDGAESNEEVAMAVNAHAPRHINAIARDIGATLVHYSTDYVFDGTKQGGYTEDASPNPISAYGRSKCAGEQAIGVRPSTEHKAPNRSIIIRTSRLYGLPGGGKESFVDKMLRLGQERNELSIIDEEVSCPTYSADLAEFTLNLLYDARVGQTHSPMSFSRMKEASGVEIFHATNLGACTWYAFAQEIFRVAEELKLIARIPALNPVRGDTIPRAAARPAYSELRMTKTQPMRLWQHALRAYLQQRAP